MTVWAPQHRTTPDRRHDGGRGRRHALGDGGRALVAAMPALPVPVLVALLLTVVLAATAAGAWRATGGRWAVVESGSMGVALPVGTLVLIEPQPLDRIEVGDIVTYQPATAGSPYTHRVVAVEPDGTLQVRGDANGSPDPWPVTQAQLLGQVVHHWRGLGWLLRALPTVLLAVVVLLAATGLYVRPRWRSSARVVGVCLVVGVVSLLLRPFVHPVLLATSVDDDGTTVRATVSSYGILPTRVTGAPGQHVDLRAGEIGSVVVEPATPGGPVTVNGSAHLTGWWLTAVAGTCLLPLLWVLVVGLAPSRESEAS